MNFFVHKVFLPYRTDNDKVARSARRGLRWFCTQQVKIEDDSFKDTEVELFNELLTTGHLMDSILCTQYLYPLKNKRIVLKLVFLPISTCLYVFILVNTWYDV